jgi:hypothetical protein
MFFVPRSSENRGRDPATSMPVDFAAIRSANAARQLEPDAEKCARFSDDILLPFYD